MRVGDRDRQRIRGVRPGDPGSRKQPRDHRVDLRFLGIAHADDRFLDQPRGIFADVDASSGRCHDNHAARLAELQARLRVLVDEDFLDGGAVGTVFGDERVELIGKSRQPLRQVGTRLPGDLTVRDVREAVAFSLDEPPAGGAEPGVETENLQARRSSSSSGTS